VAHFPCPSCGNGETRVKDVRIVRDPIVALRRRRLCPKCGDRRTTFEIEQEDMAITRVAVKIMKDRI
jgi:transcriptional regulator NrdR family protein